ncbi:putative CMP-sialic acid transporter, partial [Trichinella spiralis]|uniref:putative CMP-sialic acid transporter n=1 Tax=Trichinella spiralis TaxID=6334 RepID=UPI0001EFE2C8
KCMKYVDFSCINEGPYRLMSNNKYKMSRLKKFSEWHCVGRMVMTQFKVVTTAIFMVLLLGRSFSCRRWIAICLVSVGVSMAYLGTVNGKVENYNQAIPIVRFLCVDIYIQQLCSKISRVSLWIRNMQLYTCGLINAAIACWLTQSNEIKTFGFFHGYNASSKCSRLVRIDGNEISGQSNEKLSSCLFNYKSVNVIRSDS